MISVLVIGKGSYENCKDLALTARAFGAQSVTFTMRANRKLANYIKRTNSRWGGKFDVYFEKNWNEVIERSKNYEKVYLTLGGVPINKMIYRIRTYKNIMLIVTLQGRERDFGQFADFNVSITNQPHSTISSVAVFLHMFYSGRELAIRFNNAKYKIKQAKMT
ncbi:MAG: hypothetical protein ACP5NE_00670 [Candidatus Micrarchaeia archaeon]